MADKTTEDTARFTMMVAQKQGWVLNPDAEFTSTLVAGLTVNWNRYGYYLCPCRDSDGSREADQAVICPCSFAKSDIAELGQCFCALYLRKGFIESGGQPGGIPDRRFG